MKFLENHGIGTIVNVVFILNIRKDKIMLIPTIDGYINTENEMDYEKIYGECMDDNIYL